MLQETNFDLKDLPSIKKTLMSFQSLSYFLYSALALFLPLNSGMVVNLTSNKMSISIDFDFLNHLPWIL